MRVVICSVIAVVGLVLLVVFAGCNGSIGTCGCKDMSLVFETDFEDGSLDAWQATDPGAWRIEDGGSSRVLALYKQSNYKPEVRSPVNINLIKDVEVESFVLELKMHSTTKDYGHRDMCLFFGHQDDSSAKQHPPGAFHSLR